MVNEWKGGSNMPRNNTTHLAGEFLVAGELSRRGYPVSITMGNAKSVDIYVETRSRIVKVDAKASRHRTSWPIKEPSVGKDVIYIFVSLGSEEEIIDNYAPIYFIVAGDEIIKKRLIRDWKSIPGIPYQTLNVDEYKETWDKLPPP